METSTMDHPATLDNSDSNATEMASGMDGCGHESMRSAKPAKIIELNYPQEAYNASKRNGHRPSSPADSVWSSFSTSRRHVSRRFSSGFMRSRRYEVSHELTAHAENEFFTLMELMSSVSRRSMSLKEVWTKLITERESLIAEMDKMYEQIEEYSETIERKEKEHHQNDHDHEERKKEVNKLRIEITAAVGGVAEYKKKLTERDNDLSNVRRELREYKETITRTREDHEETKTLLEQIQLQLVASEEERNGARQDAEKHHGDLQTLHQKYTELQSNYTELINKHESTHKELVSVKQSTSILKKEKDEWLQEKGEFDESLRKSNHKCDEVSGKLEDMTEKYEKKVREVHKLKESVSKMEHEREELHQKVEELKRKLEEKHGKWEDAEDRCGKWKLKWEQSEREITSVQEEIRRVEIEKTELHETITKTREELRLLTIDKERISKDYHSESKKSEKHHRKVILLQESLRRHESTLKEKTETVHSLTERIERIEFERDDAHSRCGTLSIEIEQLQASIVVLNAEIINVTEKHDNVAEKLRECEARYEEVCESVTEYEGGNSEFEYEISTLRTMLREAREQKEKAISARNSADHERDEAMARYEEKCRELERYEEEVSQQLHARGKSESVRRTVTRSYHRVSDGEATSGSVTGEL